MGYFGSLLRCDTKVTVLRTPTKKSEKCGLKSRDHFLTRALNHLNLFEVPMPEPPLTWCFPAEFSGFSGDLAKNAFDTSEATGFVGAFFILYYMYCFWDGFWHYLRAWGKIRAWELAVFS